jgi:hypothetical protein
LGKALHYLVLDAPLCAMKVGHMGLIGTIPTNKNPFHHNNFFKLGIGLKFNEGIKVGFFSSS